MSESENSCNDSKLSISDQEIRDHMKNLLLNQNSINDSSYFLQDNGASQKSSIQNSKCDSSLSQDVMIVEKMKQKILEDKLNHKDKTISSDSSDSEEDESEIIQKNIKILIKVHRVDDDFNEICQDSGKQTIRKVKIQLETTHQNKLRSQISKFAHQMKNYYGKQLTFEIKKKADELKIFPYELKNHISAYEIIQTIQSQILEDPGSTYEDLFNALSQGVYQYIKKNYSEKGYRVIKVIQIIFKSLSLNQIYVSKWLSFILNEDDRYQELEPEKYPVIENIRKMSKSQHAKLKKLLMNQLFTKFEEKYPNFEKFANKNIKSNQRPLADKSQKIKEKRGLKRLKRMPVVKQQSNQHQESSSSLNLKRFQIDENQRLGQKNGKRLRKQQKNLINHEKNEKIPQKTSVFPLSLDKFFQHKIEEMVVKKIDEVFYSDKFFSLVQKKVPQLAQIGKEKTKSKQFIRNNKSSHAQTNPLEILELKIVEYVRKFPYSTEEQIFKETLYLIKDLKIPQHEEFGDHNEIKEWIERTFKKYGMSFNKTKCSSFSSLKNHKPEKKKISTNKGNDKSQKGQRRFVIQIPSVQDKKFK